MPYEVGTSVNGADKTFKYVLGAVAAVAIVAAIVAVRRKAASLEERAEEAYPGPLPER